MGFATGDRLAEAFSLVRVVFEFDDTSQDGTKNFGVYRTLLRPKLSSEEVSCKSRAALRKKAYKKETAARRILTAKLILAYNMRLLRRLGGSLFNLLVLDEGHIYKPL